MADSPAVRPRTVPRRKTGPTSTANASKLTASPHTSVQRCCSECKKPQGPRSPRLLLCSHCRSTAIHARCIPRPADPRASIVKPQGDWRCATCVRHHVDDPHPTSLSVGSPGSKANACDSREGSGPADAENEADGSPCGRNQNRFDAVLDAGLTLKSSNMQSSPSWKVHRFQNGMVTVVKDSQSSASSSQPYKAISSQSLELSPPDSRASSADGKRQLPEQFCFDNSQPSAKRPRICGLTSVQETRPVAAIADSEPIVISDDEVNSDAVTLGALRHAHNSESVLETSPNRTVGKQCVVNVSSISTPSSSGHRDKEERQRDNVEPSYQIVDTVISAEQVKPTSITRGASLAKVVRANQATSTSLHVGGNLSPLRYTVQPRDQPCSIILEDHSRQTSGKDLRSLYRDNQRPDISNQTLPIHHKENRTSTGSNKDGWARWRASHLATRGMLESVQPQTAGLERSESARTASPSTASRRATAISTPKVSPEQRTEIQDSSFAGSGNPLPAESAAIIDVGDALLSPSYTGSTRDLVIRPSPVPLERNRAIEDESPARLKGIMEKLKMDLKRERKKNLDYQNVVKDHSAETLILKARLDTVNHELEKIKAQSARAFLETRISMPAEFEQLRQQRRDDDEFIKNLPVQVHEAPAHISVSAERSQIAQVPIRNMSLMDHLLSTDQQGNQVDLVVEGSRGTALQRARRSYRQGDALITKMWQPPSMVQEWQLSRALQDCEIDSTSRMQRPRKGPKAAQTTRPAHISIQVPRLRPDISEATPIQYEEADSHEDFDTDSDGLPVQRPASRHRDEAIQRNRQVLQIEGNADKDTIVVAPAGESEGGAPQRGQSPSCPARFISNSESRRKLNEALGVSDCLYPTLAGHTRELAMKKPEKRSKRSGRRIKSTTTAAYLVGQGYDGAAD